MSKQDKDVVVNVNEQTEKEQDNRYAANAMRAAIIAQSLNGINHAITKEEALLSGTTEERWQQWKQWVGTLRQLACEYGELQADKNVPEEGKLMKSARNKVWSQWRTILKVGEEDLFHKNMFLRKSDVEKITTYACNITYVYVPGKGKVPSRTGENNFRKMVEVFLACRIAGNKSLSDAQRDAVHGYLSAKGTIRKTTDLLKGYKNGDEQVTGLEELLRNAEHEAKSVEMTLNALKADEKQFEQAMAGYTAKVKNIEEQVKSAKKSLETAEKKAKELEPAYLEVEAMLDAIEEPVEK